MIKVGSMVQSKYRLSSGKPGYLGLVMEMRNTEEEAFSLAHVSHPKTLTLGWVVTKDMKVVA